jgi:hypothetical protein
MRFCGGFWQKRVNKRGFSMVNLWWIRGELWRGDGHFWRSKNMPRISSFIFDEFPFWEW